MQPTKNDAFTEIQRNPLLTEINASAPTQLEQIVDIALQQTVKVNGWLAYERLKKIASRFVGYNATSPNLQTTSHYEAMLRFLCFLLPDEINGSEEPIGLPEPLTSKNQRRSVFRVINDHIVPSEIDEEDKDDVG